MAWAPRHAVFLDQQSRNARALADAKSGVDWAQVVEQCDTAACTVLSLIEQLRLPFRGQFSALSIPNIFSCHFLLYRKTVS